MTVRKLFWWAYLVILHLAALLVIAAIPEIRNRFQMQQRIPGSRLSTQYDNRPDEWMRFIMHDGRDLVVSIVDRPYGVDSILVAPPGSQYVWSFDRNEGEGWRLYISDYGTAERADTHLSDPESDHVLVDGYPYGDIDGFPDRELIKSDGLKQIYRIEPIERTLDHEILESDEP